MKDIKRGFIGILLGEIAVLMLRDKDFGFKLKKSNPKQKLKIISDELIDINSSIAKRLHQNDLKETIQNLGSRIDKQQDNIVESIDQMLSSLNNDDNKTKKILQRLHKSISELNIQEKIGF